MELKHMAWGVVKKRTRLGLVATAMDEELLPQNLGGSFRLHLFNIVNNAVASTSVAVAAVLNLES